MSVYHAQVGFRAEHGRWAASIGELYTSQGPGQRLGQDPAQGPGPVPVTGGENAFDVPPAVSLTSAGYIASVTIKLPRGKKQTWFVTEDSRLWHD